MPLTLGPLVGSNSFLLGRDVTYTPPKGPDVLVGNIPAHTGAIDQELFLLAHIVRAPSTGTYAMLCDHTRVHTRHMPYACVTSTHTSRVTARVGSDTNCNAPVPNMAKFYSAR